MVNGGIVGTKNDPSRSSASGIWTLEEVRFHVINGNWPMSPLIYYVPTGIQFEAANSQYLTWTPSGAGDSSRKFTFSCWFRACLLPSTLFSLFSAGTGNNDGLNITSTGAIRLEKDGYHLCVTNALLRDPTAFYHLVMCIDTTDGTQADRFKLYLNGTRITSFASTDYTGYVQNYDWVEFNTAKEHTIIKNSGGAYYGDVIVSDICFIDGQALTPSSFGKTDDYGNWVPIDLSGLTFGTNGFWIQDATGADQSGNGNDWTPTNSPTTIYDTPTPSSALGVGTHARMSSINNNSGTLSNAGLKWAGSGAGNWILSTHPIPPDGNIWVFEAKLTAASQPYTFIGVSDTDGPTHMSTADWRSYKNGIWWYQNNGCDGLNPTYAYASEEQATSIGYTYTTNDIIGVEVNMSTGAVKFYKNGVYQFTSTDQSGISALPTDEPWWPSCGQAYAGATETFEFRFDESQMDYFDSYDSSAKTLSTGNLADLTVADPSEHHQVELITHNGSSTDVTCNWDLDVYDTLVIAKRVDSSGQWYVANGIRGYTKYSGWETSEGESTNANIFSVSGTTLTLGSSIAAGDYYIELHRAGAVADRVTSGGDTYSANTLSGFSMIETVGTGVARTISHGLTAAPQLIISKFFTAGSESQRVYAEAVGATKYNDIQAADTFNTNPIWNNTAPTTSVFSVGTNNSVNQSGQNIMFYAWHGVEGYSKHINVTGNANADGYVVWLGGTYQSLLLKAVTQTTTWRTFSSVLDANNISYHWLSFADSNAWNTTTTDNVIDRLAGGFKARSTGTATNPSAQVTGMAFGIRPFKRANAQ